MDFWHGLLFFVGLIAGLLGGAAVWRRRQPPAPTVPTIAGQPADRLVTIDLGKRYDFIVRSREGERVVFRRCKIRGLTGEAVLEEGGWSKVPLYGWMRHWLVIEYEDGRVVYLPTDLVLYLEESTESGVTGESGEAEEGGPVEYFRGG